MNLIFQRDKFLISEILFKTIENQVYFQNMKDKNLNMGKYYMILDKI
jgi:hypothetical protein